MRILFWLGFVGCQAPERLLVIDGERGDYQLTEVSLPELEDPVRMLGSLGNGKVGGFIDPHLDLSKLASTSEEEAAASIDPTKFEYRGGGAISLSFAVDDGVGVPLDADGLSLWSYYHSLASLKEELDARGHNVDHLFPIDFAYQPSLVGIQLTATNAAFMKVGHTPMFVLQADPDDLKLPLAANPMVIRHEFGHAFLEGLMDEVYPERDVFDVRLRALNEGFADIMAANLLDDPDILGASIRDASLSETRLMSIPRSWGDTEVSDNPYEVGSVYASLAWTLRESSSPVFALDSAINALRRFGEEGPMEDSDSVREIHLFGVYLVEDAIQRDPSLAPTMCAALAAALPTMPGASGC